MMDDDRAHGREGVGGTPTEREGVTVGAPPLQGTLAPSAELGGRYRIVCRVGAGGMGEVWRAFDLKLRVEVALKALREDLFADERRRELLRSEVRAAREVVSPNVCRIYDLEEIDGRELVSMEYVDGQTLLHVLRERGPLELKQAQDIASQFLAGLEAIHKAGLVHRDIKPENIMLTRAGRVVVMDFGLARHEEDAGASRSGTPAYMAPEQAAGQVVDARADVYSAGVVLAEMVSPEGIRDIESRQSLWEGVRSEPPKLPDTPWAPVLKKAVAREPGQRYHSAHTLTRALEDVTLRVVGAEDLRPYPGLASFTEADAEYFFGREAEVEAMWRRLEGSARLLGLVGPSGAGKTSFLRAGLIPSAGAGWAIVVCTPGSDPRASLRRAVICEFEGDAEGLRELAAATDDASASAIARWRGRHDHALLIVDQFEELFTLSSAGEQRSFADLLGRLVLDADVVVLLSMRDDFLIHCNRHEHLRPLFSELTPLDPPSGAALRRALTQPALQCGYRFEGDALVEEMLGEVEGERGALPLLAFAASRLWEKRDRETGVLTRQAYQDIGGVGGALARHAEATMERIGPERIGIVRELFRNLVTAEGTRAVREWDELLSVFDDSQRDSADEVLRSLVDARLLTSYEVKDEEREAKRRVEIIHESLLANWPRLVRWQTQDADAAQLRDQLRQAARTWDEHQRTDDMLWTGSAFREFAVWRERYPGGLTELEEAFASAMTSLATRRRRRRRIAVAAGFAVLLAVLAVVGTMWRRSELETRRAEASKLLALAQVALEPDPTEALAYTTASLELADTHEARVFAVRALWAGPPVTAADLREGSEGQFWEPVFSPDGRWVAVAGMVNENVLVYHEAGGPPIVLGGHAVSGSNPIGCAWTSDNLLVTGHNSETRARVWSMPRGDLVATVELGGRAWWQVGERHLLAEVGLLSSPPAGEPWPLEFVRWKLPDGAAEHLGTADVRAVGLTSSRFDPRGGAWIYSKDDGVHARPLPMAAGAPDTLLGRHSSHGIALGGWGTHDGFYSCDRGGGVILWAADGGSWAPKRRIRAPEGVSEHLAPDPSGRWVTRYGFPSSPILAWDLEALRYAEPLQFRRRSKAFTARSFHPRGDWLAGVDLNTSQMTLWPLRAPRPTVVEGWYGPLFTADGRFLAATDWGNSHPETRVRLWPVPGSDQHEVVDLMFPPGSGTVGHELSVDPAGRHVLALNYGRSSALLSVSGEEPRDLFGFPASDGLVAGGFSPSGRLVAAASAQSEDRPTLRVWDLATDQVRILEQPEDPAAWAGYAAVSLSFLDEAMLVTAGANGLLRWDLEAGTSEVLRRAPPGGMVEMSLSADRRRMLTWEIDGSYHRIRGSVRLHDRTTGQLRSLAIPGEGFLGLSPDGEVWNSAEPDGGVLVGRIEGGEPHLLLGHEGIVGMATVSPDGRWIASSEDGNLRLWPMPDLSKPPLHTLPHDELIAKLKSLTNLRAVRDPSSSTGWSIEIGPFPGWRDVPTWNP